MDIIWLQNLRFFPLTILHFSTKTKITVAKQQILNNGNSRRALKVGFGSVWPDLAKNSALWKDWGFIYDRQNFEPTLAIFGFGPNWWLFYVDKYWKNIAIWSHCLNVTFFLVKSLKYVFPHYCYQCTWHGRTR